MFTDHEPTVCEIFDGNRLSFRVPNGVGQDCICDALSRDISCTVTAGGVTTSGFDAVDTET